MNKLAEINLTKNHENEKKDVIHNDFNEYNVKTFLCLISNIIIHEFSNKTKNKEIKH